MCCNNYYNQKRPLVSGYNLRERSHTPLSPSDG